MSPYRARVIDARVTKILHYIYRHKMTVRFHYSLEFKTKADAVRYREDYIELTKICEAECTEGGE